MAESTTPEKADATLKKSSPESPTTARELDFDDDVQDTGIAGTSTSTGPASTPSAEMAKPGSGEDVAPPKPPRPVDPRQQAEATLKEAFPSIDASVVKAVLAASGGRVEPAFNALLGMSDPSAQEEALPPAQPPRPARSPSASQGTTTTSQNQLEADEQYARQLAEHYSGAGLRGSPRGGPGRDPPMPRARKQTGLKPSELYEDGHSFIDDDLPVIKENIRKGFLETQTKVNRWVADLRKKIDGEGEDDFDKQPAVSAQGYTAAGAPQPYGSRPSGELGRRSADRDRYDSDPRVLGDDFGGLDVRDEEAHPPRTSSRPLANPDLFKPTPTTPSSDGRKVSFQAGPPEDIDALRKASPNPIKRQASPGGKTSKWEPLSTVDPTPVTDTDPFSLGDSEDERESKNKDLKKEDSERLKKAAAEAMADDIGTGQRRSLEGHARSGPEGTRDKEAEDKLTGKS